MALDLAVLATTAVSSFLLPYARKLACRSLSRGWQGKLQEHCGIWCRGRETSVGASQSGLQL